MTRLIKFHNTSGQACIERVSEDLADMLIAAELATPAAIAVENP